MKTHFRTVPVQSAMQRGKVDTAPSPPLVLVVDDEALIASTLATILNGRGLATMTALDGAAGLELACLAPPDVLITDIAMPGMDGFQLALEVARTNPECDIVLLSGEPSTCNRAAEYRAAGLDFVLLIKPAHPLDLLACVFELLSPRGWSISGEIPARSINPSDHVSFRPISRRKKPGNGGQPTHPAMEPLSSQPSVV